MIVATEVAAAGQDVTMLLKLNYSKKVHDILTTKATVGLSFDSKGLTQHVPLSCCTLLLLL